MGEIRQGRVDCPTSSWRASAPPSFPRASRRCQGFAGFRGSKEADLAFARFARRNVTAHKIPGYGIIDISLKTPGETPGDCSSSKWN